MKRAASAKSKRDSLMVVQLQVSLRENLAADYESNIESLLNIASKSI